MKLDPDSHKVFLVLWWRLLPLGLKVLVVVMVLGLVGSVAYDIKVWRSCDGIVVRDALDMPRCLPKEGAAMLIPPKRP